MARDDFRDVIQPLNLKADGRARQRILIHLAYVLSGEIRRRERKLKKGDGKNAE